MKWHYSIHPCLLVVDRGMPTRMVKLVAPDKDGAADKLCLGEGKPDFTAGQTELA